MKCKYCDNEAKGINPYNNMYLCGKHANLKCKQLMNDCLDFNSDTPKDGFTFIDSDNDNKAVVVDLTTNEIIKVV